MWLTNISTNQYQRGFAPLVIILLVVLGVGVVGGGYVVYKDKQQQKKLETQIQDLQDQAVNDVSKNTEQKVIDKNQNPATEKLVITFPTAGAKLTEGQTYNITLNNSISSMTHSVSLEDKKGNAIGLMPETGATILGKSISWKVPILEEFGERVVLPGDGFRIRIFPLGESQESYYSPVFTIVAPTTTAKQETAQILGYISRDQVGIFKIDAPMPSQDSLLREGYSLTEKTIYPEGNPQKIYVVSKNGKQLLTFANWNSSIITDIKIQSSEFRTDKGIAVGSTISDFIKAYPQYGLWYTAEEGEKFILNTAINAPTPQFFLKRENLLDSKKIFYNSAKDRMYFLFTRQKKENSLFENIRNA